MHTEGLTGLRPSLSIETQPSLYDRVSAAVVASVLIFGLLFTILFIVWFNLIPPDSISFPGILTPTETKQVEFGLEEDLLEPGNEEFPEVATPQLAKTLEAVTDVVSTVTGAHETNTGNDKKIGFGFGHGVHRLPAPIVIYTVPEHQRWVIQYEATNINTYAKQLSFFQIDIGVIHTTENKIWRVHDVGGTLKVIHSDRKNENQTIRFQHKKHRMRLWDQELCKRANVDLSGTVQSQFYPESTLKMIRKAEAMAIARDATDLNRVSRTTLKIVPQEDGFKFVVTDLKLR